ncbi:glutaredoxin family protein [Silvimonas amylolytica]|uniref:glutaredoxin family protein n=1 Tax=Silvimonas amylolytica TaxID=449663 RepID=UPI001665468B|nr:glutaredoxin family protein [Silvimonas amylolytica]
MKNRLLALVLTCLLASGWPAQAASVYQWRDDNGNLHYSDRPIFPQATLRAIKANVTDGRSASAAAAAKSGIRLYVVDNCPPCNAARELLDGNKVPYELHSISGSQQEVLSFYKLTGDTNSPLPVLAVGGDVYKGWDLSLWQAVLDKAGYHVAPPAH